MTSSTSGRGGSRECDDDALCLFSFPSLSLSVCLAPRLPLCFCHARRSRHTMDVINVIVCLHRRPGGLTPGILTLEKWKSISWLFLLFLFRFFPILPFSFHLSFLFSHSNGSKDMERAVSFIRLRGCSRVRPGRHSPPPHWPPNVIAT